MDEIHIHINKEPWLAVSLSWLLPGLGHIYSKVYSRGICLFIFAVFLHIFGLFSWISSRTAVIFSILLGLFSFLILPIYASIDAFKMTRKHNTDDFEVERTQSKDPWLAVFLSVVFPGFGHIYLRKWIFGILSFLGLFVIVFIFQRMDIDIFITVVIYKIFVCVHAYITCQDYKVKSKQPLVLFIIVYICIFFLNRFLLPQLKRRVVHIFGPLSGTSMNSTLVEGDCAVVNSITYSFNEPKLGDVIMFHPPKNAFDKKVPSGKRIIAIGGETIEIRDGKVFVDGKERNFGFETNRKVYRDSGPPLEYFGKSDNPYLTYGIDEPYSIPEGHYFVLGDNRQYSADSRYFGAVPRENIIGKVIKIYWPPRRMGLVR